VKVGSIDLGSTSIHLAIADLEQGKEPAVSAVHRSAVQLAAGWGSENHQLPSQVIDQTIEAMEMFAKMCADAQCDMIIATATAPLRESVDSVRLLEKIRDSVGISIRVLTGPEEARLIYLGTRVHLNAADSEPMVFDVGGGSTEFALAHQGLLVFSLSLSLGHMRLFQRVGHDNPVTSDQVANLRGRASAHLSPLRARMSGLSRGQLYSPSGGVRTVARLALAYPATGPGKGDTGLVLTRGVLDDLLERLAGTPREEIKTWAGMDPRRTDTVVCSAAILAAIMDVCGKDQVTTCDGGLRTGILVDWSERMGRSTVHRS
jgi:exopolyphosphatase/guanosine-5'-triphosphate,3'-diphosphate pyrophosphatase